MKRKIYKYPLDEFMEVFLPEGAWILSMQYQDDQLCLWAVVNPEAPQRVHRFRVFGTGWDFPDDESLSHVTTVQQGLYVWHVFEETTR